MVAAFVTSNFDFHTLIRELFPSPLITGASRSKTWADQGETISVARQDHLCAALTYRLGLATNLCSNITNTSLAQSMSTNIPLDGYLRGAEAPNLSTDTTLFFRGAVESLCQYTADIVVDKANSRYASSKKDSAITDLVQNIMGIPASNPNAAGATKILQDHYASAVAAGASATDALKSTFVVACTAPTSVAVGL